MHPIVRSITFFVNLLSIPEWRTFWIASYKYPVEFRKSIVTLEVLRSSLH